MQEQGSAVRYMAASACLGLIAVWGSENLFWTAPAAPWVAMEWLLTWIGYSVVAACALSAVLWTGLGGWRGAFLGGAILGFGIEGVVVATMYDAFPVQVIWTPLAWHALITGGVVLALPRVLAGRGVVLQVAGLLALGVFGALWGLYWPTERATMHGIGTVLAYQVGLGMTMVLGQIGLDRLAPLQRPRLWVLAVAPTILAALWLIRMGFTLSPVLLACPVMIGATVWIMRRLGQPGSVPDFAGTSPLWRHVLFLLAPLTLAVLVVPGWAAFGPVEVNIPVALITGCAGAGIWLGLLWKAVRAAR